MASPAVTSPRDDVLSNEDLLGIIFDYVLSVNDGTSPTSNSTGNNNSYSPRKQLLRLAQTQKAFLQPALDALWSALDGIFPLLKLLPALVAVNGVYVINGSIQDSHWEKVQSYARRVKTITFAAQGENVSPFVYQALSMYQGRKKALQLFPSLHSVTVVCDSTCDYSSIFLAIRPTLEKVEIRGVGSSSPRDVQCIQQLLLALSLQATGLKHLALKGEGTEALAPTLFHVHTFKALSSLTIDLSSLAIPLAVLNGLRALRDLKSLTLFAGTTSATSSPLPLRQVTRGSPPLPDSLAFPTLMELNLHGSASGFLRALSVVDLGDVQKIELRIAEESDSHQWRDCFHLIAAGCRQLRSIKVTPSPCFRGSCHFSLPIIEPLLDILSLTHLNLNVTSLSFSNGLISTIASSFPNLKVLSLPSTPASEYPDLGCLKFLGACKRLQWARLCLRLNPDASSHGMVPNQSLTTLYIGDAVTQSLGIQDCLSIAEFLDLMFPSLVTLERVPVMSSRRGNHGHEQTFEDIKASLNVLRATRERVHASFLKQKEMEAADCSSRNQDSI